MKTAAAIKHYGGVLPLANALKISRQAVEQWGSNVPELSAFRLEKLSRGKLKAPPVK